MQRVFTQLLVIIVVTNTIEVKNNINNNEKIEGILFFQRGCGFSELKYNLLDFKSIKLQNYSPAASHFLLCFYIIMSLFKKLVMAIVAANTINAKTT